MACPLIALPALASKDGDSDSNEDRTGMWVPLLFYLACHLKMVLGSMYLHAC